MAKIDRDLYQKSKAAIISELLPQIFRRDDGERRAMAEYLLENGPRSICRFEEISIDIRESIKDHEVEKIDRAEVLIYLLSCLRKSKQNGLLSEYDRRLYEIIERDCIDQSVLGYLKEARGGGGGSIPEVFPTMHKAASKILEEELANSINEDIAREHLFYKKFKSFVTAYSKEMFFAKKMDLTPENMSKYMDILYGVTKIQVQKPFLANVFKSRLCEVVTRGEAELVHVKCLRFSYKSGSIKILTDTEDVMSEGEYMPDSENMLFPRLVDLKKIFEQSGVRVTFHVLVSDEDVETLYPDGSLLITPEEKVRAVEDADRYVGGLRDKFGSVFDVVKMSDLIDRVGGNYQALRQLVINDIDSRTGRYIRPNYFDEKVTYQCDFNKKIFGDKYTMEEARRSVSEEIASLVALKPLLDQLTSIPIMIEERMGNDDKLVANGEVPIFFMQLHEKLGAG